MEQGYVNYFTNRSRLPSPYASRILAMWSQAQQSAIKYFSPSPGLPNDTNSYLSSIDEIYQRDAYHSLSIERYIVTPELMKLVEQDFSIWFQLLLKPFVQIGNLPAESLFGYRNDRVFIRNSRQSPPPKEAVFHVF